MRKSLLVFRSLFLGCFACFSLSAVSGGIEAQGWLTAPIADLKYQYRSLNPDNTLPAFQFVPHIRNDCKFDDMGSLTHVPVIGMGANKVVLNYSKGNNTLYAGVMDLKAGKFYGPIINSNTSTFFAQSSNGDDIYGYHVSEPQQPNTDDSTCTVNPAIATLSANKTFSVQQLPQIDKGENSGLLSQGKAMALYSYGKGGDDLWLSVVDIASNDTQFKFYLRAFTGDFGQCIRHFQEGSQVILIGNRDISSEPEPTNEQGIHCDLDKKGSCHPLPPLSNSQKYVGLDVNSDSYILSYEHHDPASGESKTCLYRVKVAWGDNNPEPLGLPSTCEIPTTYKTGKLSKIKAHFTESKMAFLQVEFGHMRNILFFPDFSTSTNDPVWLTSAFPSLANLFGAGKALYPNKYQIIVNEVDESENEVSLMGTFYFESGDTIFDYDIGTYQLSIQH